MKPQRVEAAGPASTTCLEKYSAGVSLQGRLACVNGQKLLFSPSRGAVFTLNDTAGDIWRSLEEGLPIKAVADAMAACGVDRNEAGRYLESALHDWDRLGLIRPAPPRCQAGMHDHVNQLVAVPGLCARVLYPAAFASAAAAFRHLEARAEASDVVFQLVERNRRAHLFRRDAWADSCNPHEIPIMLKGHLLAEALERASYELALHAAALFARGRALLLCGNPGAGKTTLALALTRAGLGFMADDVTLLDSAGHGVGLAFAPAVKSGSWPILAEHFPELGRSPIYRRPDGKRVRMLVPHDHVPAAPRPIGWVVLLHRTRNAEPALRPIEPSETLSGLLNGAFSRNAKLTSTAFDALCRVIRSARGFRLTYAKLDDAVNLLKPVCR